jgi:hypothetical protein
MNLLAAGTGRLRRSAVVLAVACIALLASLLPRRATAQVEHACATDRAISTLVGAGLGAAAAAIPATIVHRHDQTSSHRIVLLSVSAGALAGFLATGRDQPCASHADSSADAPQLANAVVSRRSAHASHGAVAGAVIGGLLGAVGSTLYHVGCDRDPCSLARSRFNLMLFSAGEGAAAGGILGGLIGWAWPAGRR